MSDNTNNNNNMANTSGTKSAKSNTANTSTTPKGTKSTTVTGHLFFTRPRLVPNPKAPRAVLTTKSLAAALNAAAKHQRASLTLGSKTKKNLLTAKGSKPQQSGSSQGSTNKVPDIKSAGPTKANTSRHNTDKAIKEVTMGYALMIVIYNEADERCDLGQSAILRLYEYNPHPVDERYLTCLHASIGLKSLQNKVIWNAMILAIPPAAVNQSLLQGIQLGTYENVVKWSKDIGNLEMILKLLEVKEMYVQHKRATQERKNMANYDKQQKYLLGQAWDKSMKVLDVSGCWLVHFVDKDHFMSNIPNLTLPDNDNAKLYQVLNILAMLTGKEQEEYLEQHDEALAPGPLPSQKERQGRCWLHCLTTKELGTFTGWAPIEVPTVMSTTETAKAADLDVEKTCRTYGHKMLSNAKASPDFKWDVINNFAEVVMEIWGDVTKTSGHDYPWVSSKATDLGHEISLNANTQNLDKVKVTLQNKLQWIREGWLHEPHPPKAFASIPLGNQLMFNNVQQLFVDTMSEPKLDLTQAIKEVVSWVEPFAVLSTMQRGD
ncbi:hypothetical protein EDC04DRAFT_2606010 [Pisolithus marmoratus]|nr:hypothetical protein EDC04DRAFT_2606010 [Pisolithus marmoratus]